MKIGIKNQTFEDFPFNQIDAILISSADEPMAISINDVSILLRSFHNPITTKSTSIFYSQIDGENISFLTPLPLLPGCCNFFFFLHS